MFWIVGGGTIFHSLHKIFNHPVTAYINKQLYHVKWLGFHFEDFIMPLFLFIVGVVMPYSLGKRRARGDSKKQLHFHVVKRAAVLILLGLIYDGILRFNWPEMHLTGVLQRIGVCYFFAAMVLIHTKWRTQAIVAAAILLLYWAAMMLIPVPGHGAGVLTPQGCLSSYIDQQLLPGKIHEIYYGYGDSNGIIPTLSSVSTMLLGALAGHWLRSKRSANRKAAGLTIAGLVSLITGYLWGWVFPVVRLIWTSSMVLFANGWCLLLLALFYWVIDVRGYKKWAFFFIVIGMNPITIFFLAPVVNFERIANFFVQGAAGYAGAVKPLILPLGTVMAEWLFLWFLYRHKIFFKA